MSWTPPLVATLIPEMAEVTPPTRTGASPVWPSWMPPVLVSASKRSQAQVIPVRFRGGGPGVVPTPVPASMPRPSATMSVLPVLSLRSPAVEIRCTTTPVRTVPSGKIVSPASPPVSTVRLSSPVGTSVEVIVTVSTPVSAGAGSPLTVTEVLLANSIDSTNVGAFTRTRPSAVLTPLSIVIASAPAVPLIVRVAAGAVSMSGSRPLNETRIVLPAARWMSAPSLGPGPCSKLLASMPPPPLASRESPAAVAWPPPS